MASRAQPRCKPTHASVVTGSVPLTRRQSLKVSYSDGVVVRVGGSFRILSVGWQYGWVGKSFRN